MGMLRKYIQLILLTVALLNLTIAYGDKAYDGDKVDDESYEYDDESDGSGHHNEYWEGLTDDDEYASDSGKLKV